MADSLEGGPSPSSSFPSFGPFQGHASIALAVAIIPPILTITLGKSEIWGDLFTMFLVAYYLHFIISVPHDLYNKSRERSFQSQVLESTLASSTSHPSSASTATSPLSVDRARKAASTELSRLQIAYLLFYLFSPIIAGLAFKFAKDKLFSATGPIVQQLNAGLFVFVAALRPLGHVVDLLRERTLFLRKEAAMPVTEVDLLLRRMGDLERAMETLRAQMSTKEEVNLIKEMVVEPSLDRLARTVRKVERRESVKDDVAEQRFRELERRVMEAEERVRTLNETADAMKEIQDTRRDPDGMAGGRWIGSVVRKVVWMGNLVLLPWRVIGRAVRLLSGAPAGQRLVTGFGKPMIEGGHGI